MAVLGSRIKPLKEKYDESTCVVIGESAYIVGDPMPDIRGLLHLKNEVEQKILSQDSDRQRVILALWTKNNKEIENFLDELNMLAYRL